METKETYSKIFIEQAPTAIAMLDKNMCYIAVSQKWITDYKMEGQEIIGRSHYDIFPEIGDDWKKNHQKCLNGAIDKCDEAPFVRADGSVQWIYWDVRPWYISKNIIGGLIMHTGDITHLKEKEDKRLRVEKILEKTNEIARIGTWEVDLIKQEVFWSKIIYQIHEVPENYTPTLETGIFFYKEGKSRNSIKKAIEEAIQFGTPFDLEVELVTAKKATIWLRSIGQAEIIDGKCIKLSGIIQDIDTTKRSQLALNKTNIELNAILNSEAVAIISTDSNGIINHFNSGGEALLGYSASELIGKHTAEVFHIDEEVKQFKEVVGNMHNMNLMTSDSYSKMGAIDLSDTREWTYRRKNGTTFPVQLTLTSIKNELGENIGFLGVSFDITERKRAKEELLRKNQLLNFAEEITMLGHWQWDTITDTVQWSNNLYNVFELDKETTDLNFETYFNYVHPDDKELVTEYFDNANSGKGFKKFTHRIITKGKVKTIQLLGQVFTNDEGNVIEMIGTCQDVTEQKMAENKFRGLLESAPDAMVIVNEKKEIQLINKQAERLFGYSLEELLKLPVDILIPKQLSSTDPTIKKMGDAKETVVVNKEGKEIPVQISYSPLHTEEGLLVSAAIRDITDQKLAENEILRNNQLLNFAEKITMMGNWQWDLLTNKLTWSKNLYKIFRVDENKELSIANYFDFVHPEDKEKVNDGVQKSLNGLLFNNMSHRILLDDGTVKTIKLLAVIKSNMEGEIIEMIGTCQDITEQKIAQSKIVEAKEKLEVLTKHLKSQNKQLADFAHITSHNLRAPVSNLNALIHLYTISKKEDEKKLLFDKFEIVVHHLTSTLNTLIEALKTQKETDKSLEIINFNDVLNKTKEIISEEINKNNTIINTNFSKMPEIKYHKTYLESIFLNLVTNAIKYRSPDRDPEIYIETEFINNKIRLSFQDNGLGIDLKKHGDKLFGLNKTFHRHPDAKGVGLYLTKIQIETMGGSIYVASEVNKGSVFTITF